MCNLTNFTYYMKRKHDDIYYEMRRDGVNLDRVLEKMKNMLDIGKRDTRIIVETKDGVKSYPVSYYCTGRWHVAICGGEEIVYERCDEEIKKNMFNEAEKIEKTFENYEVINKDQEKAVKIAKDFIGNDKEKLIMVGKNGTGKSHLAKAIMREWVLQGKDVGFIYAVNLRRMVRGIEQYADITEREENKKKLKRLLKKQFLIVDDIGQEVLNDLFREYLYSLLETFKGKLIMTINLSAEDFRGRYKEAILSRALYKADIIEFNWEDYRIKN